MRRHFTRSSLDGIPPAVAGLVLAVGLMAIFGMKTTAAGEMAVTVFKSPSCGCCVKWVEYLRGNGFDVEVHDRDDLDAIKKMAGVPDDLQSCHTATVEGYAIEGHVPVEPIQRLLSERPKVRGLAVPGMPAGSPGMEGPRSESYSVYSFGGNQETAVYMSVPVR